MRLWKGEADDDRWTRRRLIADGAIDEIEIQRVAVADGGSAAGGEGLADFGAIGVVLHCFGIVGGIIEDAAGGIDDGDARAALGKPRDPGMKSRAIGQLRRARLGDLEERGELVVGGTNGIALEDTGGIEIHGDENGDEEGDVGQPEFPEKPSSHGFRKDSQRRESFSYRTDAAGPSQFSHEGGGHTRPHCAV